MNEQPRRKLLELVARHGQSLVRDARRCEALLRDYCGEYRREVSVLVSALEEQIPREMLDSPAGTPREVMLARMARRLVDQRALSEPAAAWSVNSWALALGLISEEELKGFEGRSYTDAEADGANTERSVEELEGATSGRASSQAAAGAGSVVVSARGGGDYRSITEALRAVPPGARILVRPGLYEEGIILDKEISLVGDGPREEIIIRGTGASCLQASADEARVSGLTLRGEAAGDAPFFAVEILRGRLLLEDCDITSDTLSCVAVHGSEASPLIRRCLIHDGADSGLYLFDEASGTVEDCEVYGNANVGLAVTGGASPVIRRSRIYGGASAGVVAWQGGKSLLQGCAVTGNAGSGVSVGADSVLAVLASEISGNSRYGIEADAGAKARVENTDLKENGLGPWRIERGAAVESEGNRD